ncbi:MAG: ion transporter [Gemmatimonadales bacterium]|nr:ion transporter [Gemmatimonadales bacterium]
MHDDQYPAQPLRRRIHEIIFEADTPAGKLFDTILLVAIVASILVVVLESVATIRTQYGTALKVLEWVFTILFTVEYLLRLYSVRRPVRYATSFFGLVDVLAVIPTYLSVILPGAQSLLVVRILRLLRVFRVFKLAEYLSESRQLWAAMRASSRKIQIFLFVVSTIVVIVGATMHVVEGPSSGFVNIPTGIYWAIVTLTTVGYGDIAPQTPFGQFLASLVMLMGYAIIAVPTGIVTAEMTRMVHGQITTTACQHCSAEGHQHDARHCRMCGERL